MSMHRGAFLLSFCALCVSGVAGPAMGQVDEVEAEAEVTVGEEEQGYTFEELFPNHEHDRVMNCTTVSPPLVGRSLYVNRLWPNRTVRYQFAPDVSQVNRQRTLSAMAEIESACQVRFVERDEEPDFIFIVDQSGGGGNNATLGYTGFQQHLGIANWSSHSTIVHELMHSLGFEHEQKRPDRDSFITVHFENIIPSFWSQFEISDGSFMHGAYDYLSVMHYSAFAFSNGQGPAIETVDQEFQGVIGNVPGLSAGDRAALAFLYGPSLFSPNDACENAITIVGDGIYTFNNSSASQDGVDGGCQAFSDGIDNDVWFLWTAETTGPATVSTCGQTDVNTRISVYDGTACPSGNGLLACSDDSCGFGFEQAQVSFLATDGQQYLIRLGTAPNFAGGSGTFTITTLTSTVPNDNCVTAPAIEGLGTWDFDTTAATTDGFGTEACNFFGQPNMEQDIWFSWTSPMTAELTVSTCGDTAVDTKLAVLDGDSCSAPVLACSDDACESLQAEVRVDVVAGETYLIRIGSHPGTPGGEGVLTIDERPPPPANDDCFDAIVVGLGDTPFSNLSATTDGPLEPALCTPRADVWFVFQPPEDGEYVVSTCGADFNTVLLVREGGVSCDVSDEVDDFVEACNDDACGTASEVTFAADDAHNYLIRVGGSEFAQGSGVLSIAPAPTDDCPCDLVGDDGMVDVFDLLAYLDLWFAEDPAADLDGQPDVTVFDLLAYLDCWFAGC